MNNWDDYFYKVCESVASKSPCLSRKVGAILVKDHSIVSTGYNGPPRNVPHCGHERVMKDEVLVKELHKHKHKWEPSGLKNNCPRKNLRFKTSEGLEWCTAQHAEVNCLINASRLGVSTFGAALYMNCILPCKNCFGALINAGVAEIVVDDDEVYDKYTTFLIRNSDIKIRRFE